MKEKTIIKGKLSEIYNPNKELIERILLNEEVTIVTIEIQTFV